MEHDTWGIHGWTPRWHDRADDLIAETGEALRDLIGRKLTAAWLLWDDGDDSWWADAPVVLDFEGRQLEVCAHQHNRLSITFGQIDVRGKVEWIQGETELVWVTGKHERLSGLQGQQVVEIRLLEDCLMPDLDAAQAPCGIQLRFTHDTIAIRNGGDENAIQ